MTLSTIYPVAGIKIATTCAKIKQNQRDDLVLFEITPNSNCARSSLKMRFVQLQSALPVSIYKQYHLVIYINSGNANAGMGEV
ncbi:MAG: hypothetical protein R3E08_03625 [Thiotrichaceae bacterium]